MRIRRMACCLLLPATLALSACGGGEEIDPATYTCGDFAKSLDTKDDRSAGSFIRLLNDRAKSKGPREVKEKRMAYAIYVACRGEKASFRPANVAVANAKKLEQGKRVVPRDVAEREKKAAEKAATEEPAE